MTEGQRMPVLSCEPLRLLRPAAGLMLELPALDLPAGGALALLGPSGSGKSTALLGLLGLGGDEIAVHGAVTCSGSPRPTPGSPAWRSWLRHDIAWIAQDARAALDPVQTLGQQLHDATDADAARVHAALAALDLGDAPALLRRYPHQVSGGQAQRLLLALALLRRPKLLVADEPTASLDAARRGLFLRELAALRERGTAVLLATHDLSLVEALGAQVLRWEHGTVQPGLPAPVDWPRPAPVRAAAPVVLRARGLELRRGATALLRGVALDLRAGEVVALLGPSGVGKTSLALALAGLLPPTAGSVDAARGAVQVLFQDAYASLTPGRRLSSLLQETAAAATVQQLAPRLGLGAAELARTGAQLSGGQRRRAALLRALTVAPRALILDEPTASLDAETACAVLATVFEVAAAHDTACLLITHDETLARSVAHRRLRIHDGRCCEDGDGLASA